MSALICRVKAGLMLLLTFTCSFTRAFNLDTHHPVIFRSPLGGGESLSYFGFAVALTQTSQTGQWVLVGAPRANSTLGLHDVRDTGALFRCSLATVKCEEVVVDPTGNARHTSAPPYYMDRKQGSWTGGTLTAVPREHGRVAVCGQLWSNQLGGKDYYANGVCYWMDSEVRDYNASKKVPLLDNTKQVLKRSQEEDIKMYGYGQAGTSAHFAKNGEELLMGAPGVYNWKGTVVRYSKMSFGNGGGSVLRRRRREAQEEIPLGSPDIAASYLTDDIQKNDYFGYSVSSGEFMGDDKTYYVAGAPRAAYGKGKVFVFDFPSNDLDPIQMELERVGEQVGEYFGHSLLSADLSGDGWPELLVGAPLWGAAHGYEEGRVYVFPNVGGRRLGEEALILGGDRIAGSRFGFSLANIGDLDLDGYQDLAVGAPYEDNGRGAIYIYLGGPSGVSAAYSQKILASQFSDGLRAFGISLSSGIDMDGNQYTDIAVGSYLSGEAVLLRSQPVLRFHADLRPNVDRLHVTDKQFSVTACLKYFGRYLVDSITADIQLRVESLQIRAVFRQDGVSQDSVRYSRSLDYDAYRCDDWTVDLESEVIDFTQPIVLSMYYNLTKPTSGGDDGSVRPVYISTDTTPRSRRQASSALLSDFCSSCPVVNRRSAGQTHVTAIVPFSLGCGDDNVCNTDLKVAVSLSGLGADGRLVIGAAPILDLDVLVTNEGESASIPRLEVSLPSPLRLVRIPQLCSELEQGDMVLLHCDLRPHPLINGGQASLQLKLNTEQLVPGTEQLQLLFNVSSSGVELMADDNLLSYSLMLKTEADIAATGEPVADPMYYDKREDRDEAERNEPNYVKVQQRFRVERFLPSPVEAVNISFLVPVNMTDEKGAVVRFLDVFRPQATFNSRSVNCKISTGYYLAKDGDSYVEVGRAWSDGYRLTAGQLALLDKHSPVPSVPGNLGTHLSCTQSTVSCVRIRCPPVSFRSRQAAATVLLEMRVKLHELEPRVGKRDRIIVSTVCVADVEPVPYPLQPANGRPDLVQVHTRLLPSSLQPFPVWIIVVTVIGSLLLLAAITYGLYKAGFFKRRRRPEDV